MRLAVIGTFYQRHENTFPLMHRLFVDGTHKPAEAWLMCEGRDDVDAIQAAIKELIELEVLDGIPKNAALELYPTPKLGDSYAHIPYSYKINAALDELYADAVVYLDNNSMPAPEKYEIMLTALEENPDWGAVYCTQKRTGFAETLLVADDVVDDAFCHLNYTQVMHRVTDDRWPLEMRYANPDIADGLFWRELHKSLGPFYPAGGERILDTHHIPSPAAAGL